MPSSVGSVRVQVPAADAGCTVTVPEDVPLSAIAPVAPEAPIVRVLLEKSRFAESFSRPAVVDKTTRPDVSDDKESEAPATVPVNVGLAFRTTDPLPVWIASPITPPAPSVNFTTFPVVPVPVTVPLPPAVAHVETPEPSV